MKPNGRKKAAGASGRRPGRRSPRQPLPGPLRPLAPFLYLVWSDGALSAEEVAALREQASRLPGLDEGAQGVLAAWLDPASPPTPGDLAALLETMRDGGGEAAADLVELGVRLAGQESAAVRDLLRELQDTLGMPAAEAARAVESALAGGGRRPDGGGTAQRSLRRRRQTAASLVAPPDPELLNAYLDADHGELRREVLELLQRPDFAIQGEPPGDDYREKVLLWCRLLGEEGYGALAFPREFGGAHDAGAAIAAFETLAYHDLSLLVKYGVQFGLFAGSIYLLGTRKHHEKYLADAASLRLPGCFAMTETGHGSNVRELQTTAEYDAATAEFVIHTPVPEARKDWIGNAALHGRLAVVFAQLSTAAGRHGVHAFLVPIRDEAGMPMPGVSIEDCGAKVGLNGVDNGRITFSQVRVPRGALLDRYGSVSEGGEYSSPIASPTRRFFTMLGTLVAGRISIACASLSAGKSGLTIAIRYTARRRQFGPEGGEEVPVLDYTVVQRALLPRMATACALHFALRELVRRFAASGGAGSQEMETLAAALKAYASDWTAGTLQAAREACGGQGYLAENRLGRIRADTDVFTTFEGANDVLLQLVARGRLTEYRHQFGELRVWGVARYLGGRAATRVTELNPIVTRRTDPEHLMDPAFHAAALGYREERLVASLARRLKRRLDAGMDGFDALNQCQDHAVEVGRAFAEHFLLEQFQAGAGRAPPELRPHLERLCALYALDRLLHSSAWYLEAGYMEPGKTRAVRQRLNDLCAEVRPWAESLASAFGIPDALLAAPIGLGGGRGQTPVT
jgi:acyl-CoA oxidase